MAESLADESVMMTLSPVESVLHNPDFYSLWTILSMRCEDFCETINKM